jgi:hypothetical protein
MVFVNPEGVTPMPAKKPEILKMPVRLEYTPEQIPNVHPVDELSAVREEIKLLEARADELRQVLLAEGADLNGDQYIAVIQPGVRETLDRKALIDAFGEAAIFPFIKATHFKTVKLVEK